MLKICHCQRPGEYVLVPVKATRVSNFKLSNFTEDERDGRLQFAGQRELFPATSQ